MVMEMSELQRSVDDMFERSDREVHRILGAIVDIAVGNLKAEDYSQKAPGQIGDTVIAGVLEIPESGTTPNNTKQ